MKKWAKKAFRLRHYPEYILVNGVKVRYTGPLSVSREDALRARWSEIQRIISVFNKANKVE